MPILKLLFFFVIAIIIIIIIPKKIKIFGKYLASKCNVKNKKISSDSPRK